RSRLPRHHEKDAGPAAVHASASDHDVTCWRFPAAGVGARAPEPGRGVAPEKLGAQPALSSRRLLRSTANSPHPARRSLPTPRPPEELSVQTKSLAGELALHPIATP